MVTTSLTGDDYAVSGNALVTTCLTWDKVMKKEGNILVTTCVTFDNDEVSRERGCRYCYYDFLITGGDAVVSGERLGWKHVLHIIDADTGFSQPDEVAETRYVLDVVPSKPVHGHQQSFAAETLRLYRQQQQQHPVHTPKHGF